MDTKDALSQMRGVPVVTLDSGVNLGYVAHVFVDPSSRQLSAVSFKNRLTDSETFVQSADITLVGHDVMLVRGEDVAKPMAEQQLVGTQLVKLRGMPVMSQSGRTLGKLEDFDISHDDRSLNALHFAGGATLQVQAGDVVIGPDAIVVPAHYADLVVHAPDKPGFFQRMRHWTESMRERRRSEGHEAPVERDKAEVETVTPEAKTTEQPHAHN